MVKWYYSRAFLEHQEILFIACLIIILLIILATAYLVYRELRGKNVHS